MNYKKYLSILSFGLLLGSLAPMQTLAAAAKNGKKVEQKKEAKKAATFKKQTPRVEQKKKESKKSAQQIAYEQWEASQAGQQRLAEKAAALSSQSSSSKQEIPARVAASIKLEIPKKQEPKLEQKQEPVIIQNKQEAISQASPANIENPVDIAFTSGDIKTLKALGIRDSMLRLRMKYPISGRSLDANAIKEIENIIGYTFQNKDLLIQALTSEKRAPKKNYEIFEFVGDKILEAIISEMLFDYYENPTPHQLTKMRDTLVSQEPMAALCIRLGLHEYVQCTESRIPISMLCDIIESLIFVVYKDGGYKMAQNFVHRFFLPMIQNRCPIMMTEIIRTAKEKLEIDVSYEYSSYYLRNLKQHKQGSLTLNPKNCRITSSSKANPMRLASYLADREFIETQLPAKYKKQLVRLAIDADYKPLETNISLQQAKIQEERQATIESSDASSQDFSSNSISDFSSDSNSDSSQDNSQGSSPELSSITSGILEIPNNEEFQLEQEESVLDQSIVENPADIAFANGDVESLTDLIADLGISTNLLTIQMKYPTLAKILDKKAIENIEMILSYTFKKKDLLVQVLTSKEQNPEKNYTELQISGKIILNAIITEMLLQKYKVTDKKQLAAMRQALMGQEPLAALSIRLGLHEYVQHNESTLPISTLSDIIESLVGAIYKDKNLQAAQSFVNMYFLPMIQGNCPLMPEKIIQLAENELDINVSYDHASSYLPKLKRHLREFQSNINPRQSDTISKDSPLHLAYYLAEKDFIETQLPSWCKEHLVRLAIDVDYQALN